MPHPSSPHIGTHWRALNEPSPMMCQSSTPKPHPSSPHIGTHWRALNEPSPMMCQSSTPKPHPSHWYSMENSQRAQSNDAPLIHPPSPPSCRAIKKAVRGSVHLARQGNGYRAVQAEGPPPEERWSEDRDSCGVG